MRKHRHQVDASVEASGRHNFAVRIRRPRHERRTRPSHPASNVRDDRETPLLIRPRTCEEEPLICPTAQAHTFPSTLADQISLNEFSNSRFCEDQCHAEPSMLSFVQATMPG
jgi:hypothetical protein